MHQVQQHMKRGWVMQASDKGKVRFETGSVPEEDSQTRYHIQNPKSRKLVMSERLLERLITHRARAGKIQGREQVQVPIWVIHRRQRDILIHRVQFNTPTNKSRILNPKSGQSIYWLVQKTQRGAEAKS